MKNKSLHDGIDRDISKWAVTQRISTYLTDLINLAIVVTGLK